MKYPFEVLIVLPDGSKHTLAYRSSERRANDQADAIRESFGSGQTAATFDVIVVRRD